jgi:hypothetical protein
VEDADETLEGFAWSCAQAGPKACALAKEDSTQWSIVDFVDDLIAKADQLFQKKRETGSLSRYSASFVRCMFPFTFYFFFSLY